MINQQPIEKRHFKVELDVHSIFYTIQGEGPFCGTPAVFVRLAGCNLQCPACDTDYTSTRRMMTAEQVVDQINNAYGHEWAPYSGLVVITGGEPFRQDVAVSWLTLMLQQRQGCYVQVETNGALSPETIHTLNKNTQDRRGMYIVVSPKTGKVNPVIQRWACAYKYVMNADSVAEDGLPQHALHHTLGTLKLARPPSDFKGTIYLQPQDDKDEVRNKANLDACVKSCMRHGYVLQLQVHKLLGLE
jgi:7-carboxy-7-deazaguanine synthase